MPIVSKDTVQPNEARQAPCLDLRQLPDDPGQTKGGSIVGRAYCAYQLAWREYLDLRARFDHGDRLTGSERARLWRLIVNAEDGGGDATG